MEINTPEHMNLLKKSVTLGEFPQTERSAGFKTSFKLIRIYLEAESELPGHSDKGEAHSWGI